MVTERAIAARRSPGRDDMTDIEARFERDMVEKVYRAAGRETGYWAGYFLRSVKRYGGVGAARRLLERGGVSQGLAKLASLGRLDLAMETLVLDRAYALLFTDEERAIAARRLDEARAAAARAPA
jgi:5-methylcytosine-specific restriction protein A